MPFPDNVPRLTDDVVTLRAHTAADIDPVHAMCQDPDMQRWTTVPVPYLRENAVYFLTELVPAGWNEQTAWTWAIEYQGRFAGTIDLRDGEGGVGSVGFAAVPEARGAGVMTRALRLVVRYAFDELGWDRVIWGAFVGNYASRRVAWKAGFHGLVEVPGHGRARGERRDEWIATVGREDPLEPQGNWWSVPVLEGDGIRLREMRMSDAPRVQEACADERTQYWLSGMPSPYQLSDAEGFLTSRQAMRANGNAVSWTIADQATDELLANLSIFDLNDRMDRTIGEIGYWAHPDARGRKVMTKALGLAIAHAFKPIADGGLGRRRLVLLAAEGNTASMHVAEANGFTHVGRQRAASPRRDGQYDDLHIFDLLATEHTP